MTTYKTRGTSIEGNIVSWQTFGDLEILDAKFHEAIHETARREFVRIGFGHVETTVEDTTERTIGRYPEQNETET